MELMLLSKNSQEALSSFLPCEETGRREALCELRSGGALSLACQKEKSAYGNLLEQIERRQCLVGS